MAKARRLGAPRKAANNGFARWFDASKWRADDLAKLIGVSVKYIYNLRSGRYRPSIDVLAAIERVSKGVVTASTWDGKAAR